MSRAAVHARKPVTVKPPTLAIVTPWRDHLELADGYFNAVEQGQPDQLVVVDDGSETPLPFAATRIEPSGFCSASNAGLDLVETEYVLFMNNDVEALRPGWLDEIRAQLTPGVVVGPLRFDDHGDVDGMKYPYVDGWCAAMLTEDARRVRWDERYDEAGPAYFSDNAFSFQARLAGLTLREHRPGLHHKTGQTGGIDKPLFEHALAVNGPLFQEQVRAALA